MGHQGDNHGVGAWKVLRVAFGAVPHLSPASHRSLVTAYRTKPVAAMPVDLRTRLRDYPGVGPAERLCNGPGILEPPSPALTQSWTARSFLDTSTAKKVACPASPKNIGAVSIPSRSKSATSSHPRPCPGSSDTRNVQVPQRQEPASGVPGFIAEPLFITSLAVTPVQRVAGIHVGNIPSLVGHSLILPAAPGRMPDIGVNCKMRG